MKFKYMVELDLPNSDELPYNDKATAHVRESHRWDIERWINGVRPGFHRFDKDFRATVTIMQD